MVQMLGWSNDRGDLGLLEEPLLGRVVLRQLRRQHLDRHVPIQARVSGLIDDAHTAGYQAGRRFHMTELRTGSEGHGGELFYREGKSVMVVAVASTPSSWSPDGEALAQKPETFNVPTVSRPQVVFGPVYYAGERRSYDISADGRRFVMITE